MFSSYNHAVYVFIANFMELRFFGVDRLHIGVASLVFFPANVKLLLFRWILRKMKSFLRYIAINGGVTFGSHRKYSI